MTELDECYHSTVGDMENHATTLWKDLQRENKLPLGGVLMSSCEQELQELVRQIDIMVKSRENQLRQQTRRVQKQLESKTKECLQQKQTLDENFKKIMTLHSQLDNTAKERQDVVHMYETQLSDLKAEASRLRNEHERLHKKYQRKMRDMDKQGRTASELDLERSNEIKQLTNQLKESEEQNQNLELKNKELLSQMENLDIKYRGLSDKYQIQQQLLESKEQKFNSERDMLEDQLTSVMATVSAKDTCIDKMQAAMELLSKSQKRTIEENKRLLHDQKVTNSNLQTIDTEKRELIQKVEDYEKQRQEDDQEIQNLQDQILKKDEELTDLSNTEKLLKEAICAMKLDLEAKNKQISQLEQQTENLKSNPSEELQNKQLTSGQLDSLRSENHLLRQALIQQKGTVTNEQMEPRDSYTLAVELSKVKNEKLALQKTVNELSTQLKNCEIDFRQKIQDVMKKAQQAVEDIKNKHAWKIQKTMEETEKKLQLQWDERQQLAQQQAEEIKSLKQQIANLEQELSEEKENSKKAEEEADVLSRFTKEVDDIVQQSTPTSKQVTGIQASSQIVNDARADDSVFSIEKVKFQEYLSEEDNCRKEWEDSFEKNLQQIWQKTEATLQQFIENT